jgi:hypothetical protein
MNETSYQLRYYGGGSHPSEAHGGGWEGLWQGWIGTDAVTVSLIISSHGDGEASGENHRDQASSSMLCHQLRSCYRLSAMMKTDLSIF